MRIAYMSRLLFWGLVANEDLDCFTYEGFCWNSRIVWCAFSGYTDDSIFASLGDLDNYCPYEISFAILLVLLFFVLLLRWNAIFTADFLFSINLGADWIGLVIVSSLKLYEEDSSYAAILLDCYCSFILTMLLVLVFER